MFLQNPKLLIKSLLEDANHEARAKMSDKEVKEKLTATRIFFLNFSLTAILLALLHFFISYF